jgi:hypothetical protein
MQLSAVYLCVSCCLCRLGLPHCYRVADERNVHVTFALEVGRAQSWRLLEQKAAKWANVPGIQIILLLKVNK